MYTNDMLYKFKKVESPLCYWCKTDFETLEHFLFQCPRVSLFWNEVEMICKDKLKLTKHLEIRDVIFGIVNLESNSKLINYIILESKYLLHFCKLSNKIPTPQLLLERIKNTYKIETLMASERNNLSYHYQKWEPLIALFSP